MPGEETKVEPQAPTITPPVVPPPAEPEGDKQTLTTAQLADRMARHTRSTLKKELGIEDTAEVKAKLARLADLEAEHEKQRLATLSADQRAVEERLKLEQRALAAETRAAAAEMDARTSRVYAEVGIKNPDYATFKLNQALASGQPVDERKFFEGLLTDKRERVALGLDEPGGTPTVPSLPTTSPGNGNPPAPKPAGAPGGKKTAFDMTAAEWQAYKETNGL